MEKCFVTKLSGRTDNQNLLKIGEMRIYFAKVSGSTPRKITLSFKDDCQVSINGGYFTDNSFSINIGTTENFAAATKKDLFISNDECYVSIENKYSLKEILCTCDIKSFDISSLKYSNKLIGISLKSTGVYGNISDLKNLTSLYLIEINSSNVTGDISSLKNLNLKILQINSPNVTGDISSLQNMTTLASINIDSTAITGDISALQKMSKLNIIVLDNTQVSGDVSSFNNLSSLTTLYCKAKFVTGEISLLPANLKILTAKNEALFKWKGTRPSASSIISLENVRLGSDVDSMLNNMANCTDINSSSGSKFIKVIGTKTSASDTAVATLQQKGYTVSITPA